MVCPSCRTSTSRIMLTQDYFRCTNQLSYRRPTGAHPSGAFGPAFEDVWHVCNTEYYDIPWQPGQTTCPTHSLIDIGVCKRCTQKPICGDCPDRMCGSCIAAVAWVASGGAARAQAERKAEESARRSEHEARIRANAVKHPKSQEFYLGRIRKINSDLSRVDRRASRDRPAISLVEKGAIVVTGTTFLLWIAGGSPTNAPTLRLLSIVVLLGIIALLWRKVTAILARSKQASLGRERDEAYQALGCGHHCQFGCRSRAYEWSQTGRYRA